MYKLLFFVDIKDNNVVTFLISKVTNGSPTVS